VAFLLGGAGGAAENVGALVEKKNELDLMDIPLNVL